MLDKVAREKQELQDKYNALRDQRGDSDDRMASAEFKVIAVLKDLKDASKEIDGLKLQLASL